MTPEGVHVAGILGDTGADGRLGWGAMGYVCRECTGDHRPGQKRDLSLETALQWNCNGIAGISKNGKTFGAQFALVVILGTRMRFLV